MIGLFSDLQQKGDPPEGIAPSYGFFWFRSIYYWA